MPVVERAEDFEPREMRIRNIGTTLLKRIPVHNGASDTYTCTGHNPAMQMRQLGKVSSLKNLALSALNSSPGCTLRSSNTRNNNQALKEAGGSLLENKFGKLMQTEEGGLRFQRRRLLISRKKMANTKSVGQLVENREEKMINCDVRIPTI